MLRHTFAISKLNAGASPEDVSLLLGHRSIKITERFYLRFDRTRQQRLTRAAMVDWTKKDPAPKGRVLKMKAGTSV